MQGSLPDSRLTNMQERKAAPVQQLPVHMGYLHRLDKGVYEITADYRHRVWLVFGSFSYT